MMRLCVGSYMLKHTFKTFWIFSMASVSPEEAALELPIRRKIYDEISRTPGIYFRDLQRRLGLPVGSLDYHLHYMEARGIVVSRQGERYNRYYISGTTVEEDRKIMAALRIGGQRRILMRLLLHPGLTIKEISDGVGLSPGAVAFHIKRRFILGVVKKGVAPAAQDVGGAGACCSDTAGGARSACYIVSDPDKAAGLLVKYKPGFLDSGVDRFVESWVELK